MGLIKDTPLVSVAVVTYNQEIYIADCIESILRQCYSNIEIVVADDGSTDGTQSILIDYKKKHPNRFRLSLSKENMGITENSNRAHFLCSGKYIAWMGGDDLMLPEKISIQVDYMEKNPDCTISYHNLDVFESKSGKSLYLFNEHLKYEGDVRASIRHGTFNGACSTMVRTSKTPKNGFNRNIPVASDWLYWINALHNGGTINYIDRVLGRYRRHDNNVTKKTNEINQGFVDRLNTCNHIIALNPSYLNDVIFRYSEEIYGKRYQLPYFKAVSFSFFSRPRLRVFFKIVLYLISAGKVKM